MADSNNLLSFWNMKLNFITLLTITMTQLFIERIMKDFSKYQTSILGKYVAPIDFLIRH